MTKKKIVTLQLFGKNILTHLNTVIPNRVKRAKEEMLLNPHPVLVGISKGEMANIYSNKYNIIILSHVFCKCSNWYFLTQCSASPQPGPDRPWWQWTALPSHWSPPLPLPWHLPRPTPSAGPARHIGAHWSYGWNTTARWCPVIYAIALPGTHTEKDLKGRQGWCKCHGVWVKRGKKTIISFTLSLSLGMMTLKCTRTDRKVQMLVLVFSWFWRQEQKSASR